MSGENQPVTISDVPVFDVETLIKNVEQNSKTIDELKTLPAALSELKALMLGLPGPENSDIDDSITEDDDGQCDGDIEDEVQGLIGKQNVATLGTPSLSNTVSDILNQTQAEPEYGPKLNQQVADSFNRLINKKTGKEAIDKWREEFKAPENCKTLGVPRVNHEIWSALPNKARQIDVHYQNLQSTVSMTSVALAKMAEKLATEGSSLPGQWQSQLLQAVLECATINSCTNQALIAQRKRDMKPMLSKEAAAICSGNNVTTEYLFGDNFQDEIKASKSALNIVKQRQFKFPQTSRSDIRPHPYRSMNTAPGNFRRPSRGFQRGGQRQRTYQRQYNPKPMRVFPTSMSPQPHEK